MTSLNTCSSNCLAFSVTTVAGATTALPFTWLFGAFPACQNNPHTFTILLTAGSAFAILANGTECLYYTINESMTQEREVVRQNVASKIYSLLFQPFANFFGGFSLLAGGLMLSDSTWTCETSSSKYPFILLYMQLFFILGTLHQISHYLAMSEKSSQRNPQVAPEEIDPEVEMSEEDDDESESSETGDILVITEGKTAIIQRGAIAFLLPGSITFFPPVATAARQPEPTAPPLDIETAVPFSNLPKGSH